MLHDYLIIGAGAVGTAIGRELTLRGQHCLLVEKNDQVLSEASSGNTGHFAQNFYFNDERAPLEYEIMKRARVMNKDWLKQQPNVPMKMSGLLYVARSDSEMAKLRDMRQVGLENEIETTILSPDEIRNLEEAMIHDDIVGGLLSELEFVVDPFFLPISNLFSALENGCQLETSCEIVESKFDKGIWTCRTQSGKEFQAKIVVNCAGNFSDLVDEKLSQNERFHIRPAKGSFLVLPKVGSVSVRHMIVNAPSETTAGLYIFKSVYGNVVVGPDHNYQESKSERACQETHLDALWKHGRKYFPHIETERNNATYYCGLRPACRESEDYQIHFSPNLVTVGGIRSTGLTAARAIAEYVANKILPDVQHIKKDVVMPKPELNTEDESVKIGNYVFKPTHHLTVRGLFGD